MRMEKKTRCPGCLVDVIECEGVFFADVALMDKYILDVGRHARALVFQARTLK